MKSIDKLHLAITIQEVPLMENERNRGRNIPYVVEHLDMYKWEISIIGSREPFTEEEAEERYINAQQDKEELIYDRRLYAQECADNNF